LIAAAGYIINDYFDLNIDQVNKPESIVVQKFIRRRSAIIWHMSFFFRGCVVAFYIGFKIGNWILGFANLVCVFTVMGVLYYIQKKTV
jgi:4-hydroxybenzoate polyprenyltransferase